MLQSCCRSLLRMGAVVSLGLALPHYEASPHPKGPPAADYRVTPVVFGEQYMSGNQFSLAVSTKIDHDDLREKGDVMDSRGRRHFRICGEENAQRNNCWLVLDATGAAVLFISKNTDSGAWQLCRDNERRVLIIKSQSPAKRARFQVRDGGGMCNCVSFRIFRLASALGAVCCCVVEPLDKCIKQPRPVVYDVQEDAGDSTQEVKRGGKPPKRQGQADR